jgi:hypothetical protein
MNENISALVAVSSIAGLVFMAFWLYRDYRVDVFRQEMFALRDSLFDKATAGLIEFEAPAYGILRSTMNGFIRFGHRLTLPNVFFIVLTQARISRGAGSTSFKRELNSSLETLTASQRALIQKYNEDINFLIVRHLLLSSPLLLISVVVPLIVTVAAGSLVGKVVKALGRPLDRLDSLALAEGKPA